MPNSIDRRVSPGAPLPQTAETATPVAKPAEPARIEQPVDGVEAARPAPVGGAENVESPRKALNSKLGTMGRRILQGAAVLGLAAAMAVGGSIFMQMQSNKPVQPPVQIEAPVEIQPPGLPQGQAPPTTDAKPQTTAPGSLPSAPTENAQPTDTTPLRPQVYSPQTIRLDTVLPNR